MLPRRDERIAELGSGAGTHAATIISTITARISAPTVTADDDRAPDADVDADADRDRRRWRQMDVDVHARRTTSTRAAGATTSTRPCGANVCVVDHRIPQAVEPQCLDAEGVKTFLPKLQMVAALRAKGTPEADIRKAVKTAFANGTLKAPSRPGVIYMLSPHNVVTIDEVKRVVRRRSRATSMFYAPNLTSAESSARMARPHRRCSSSNEGTPHAP